MPAPQPHTGPPLNPADALRVEALVEDIACEARGRDRFSYSPLWGISEIAAFLVRYRVGSLGILRRTQRGYRALFSRDSTAYFLVK